MTVKETKPFKRPKTRKDALKLFWREFAKIAKTFRVIAPPGSPAVRQVRGIQRICPICAVVNKLLNRDEWSIQADLAGRDLGLGRRDIRAIAVAADVPVEGHRNERYSGFRRRMFKLMGRKKGL